MEYGIKEVLSLLGSLALFLYGMQAMSDALMEVAGDRMRSILATMTSNRLLAVLTGLAITATIQSSSATTLMVVSFVNASLLTLFEAVGVILGAHIGTTFTAWLITLLGFKISMSAIALPLLSVGFLMTFSSRRTIKYWGRFLVGFCLLFIGLDLLQSNIPDPKSHPEILGFIQNYTSYGFWSVLIFLLIGTLITVIVQSSSATMALTLVMCYEGWIPFDLAAAMVLGENIGTTVTALLAAMVGGYRGKRAAVAHLIMQVVKVTLVLAVFYPFLRGVDIVAVWMSGVSAFDSAKAIPVALSLFHTLFNVISVAVLIWFIPLVVRLVTFLVKETKAPDKEIDQPMYLNNASLAYPQTAMRALLNESKRLYENSIYKAMVHGLNAHRSDLESEAKLKDVLKQSEAEMDVDIEAIYYNRIKTVYSEILRYATLLQSRFAMSTDKIEWIDRILIANRNIVAAVKKMKDLHKNITKYGKSDNSAIRKEYDNLRKMILRVIREINRIAASDEVEKHLAKLRKLRGRAHKSDVLLSGRIDQLIREDAITSEMASSLINDCDLAIDICNYLIAHAELIYVDRDTILEDVPREEAVE